jgi:peptidoglycan/LPS O-acetylase OafA/YrhL
MNHHPLARQDGQLEQPYKYRIKGLDGIRGICAICVVVHHTIVKTNHIGEVSVYVFFVLSGFLIMDTIRQSRQNIEHGRSDVTIELTIFLRNRMLRIMPIYYMTIFAIQIYDYIMNRSTFADITGHIAWYITYTQTFFISFVSKQWGSFTHSWSLAVEQQFYIIFAAIFLFTPSRLHKILYVFTVIVMYATYCIVNYSGANRIAASILPFLGFSFILMGGMVRAYGMCWLDTSWVHRHREAFIWALSAVILSLSIMPGSLGTEWSEHLRVPAPLICAIIAIASSLLLCLIYMYQKSSIVAILDLYPLRMLGKISYAIYVFHYPIIYILHDWIRECNYIFLDPAITAFILTTLLSILLAALSYRFVERPIGKLKQKPA